MYAANWNYVKTGLTHNLGRVVQFYRRNPMAVQSDHFLVRILQAITIPVSMPLERYFSIIDASSLDLSMSLKMTSSIYKGTIFPGVFYGPNSSEVLVAHDEYFDYVEANKNWQNLCPVKVLSHPYTDLSLNIPNGYRNDNERGVAVIAIDITLLAIQYRAWRRNEFEIAGGLGESPRSIMQFIHMYVLPNMLFSHLDYTLLNRMYNLVAGTPNAPSKSRHSFYITDFSDKLNDVQETLIEGLAASKRNMMGILRNIPAVTKPTMEEVLDFPKMLYTRQVSWALIISRLTALRLLIDVSDEEFITKNQNETNYLLREMIRYRSDGTLRDMLPMNLYYDTQYDLDYIAEKLRRIGS